MIYLLTPNGKNSWDKVFKIGLSNFFKDCLPQNILIPLLKTLSQLISRFFLWKLISTLNSLKAKAWLGSFTGMFSRTYNKTPPPFLLRSNLKCTWKTPVNP